MANWAESLCNMVRKAQAAFIPARIHKSNYGVAGANPGDAFIWNAPAMDSKEDYETDVIKWKTDRAAGMKQFQEYKNNGEYIMLVGGPPTLYGQFAKSYMPYFFVTLWYIILRGIDCKNFETFFCSGKKLYPIIYSTSYY